MLACSAKGGLNLLPTNRADKSLHLAFVRNECEAPASIVYRATCGPRASVCPLCLTCQLALILKSEVLTYPETQTQAQAPPVEPLNEDVSAHELLNELAGCYVC